MRPFPCLTTKESQPSKNGKQHVTLHTLTVHFMAFMHCQHHGNGTDDEDKSHKTYERQRQIHVAGAGKGIKHPVWIGPVISAKAGCAITDKECAKSKGITHQEIPHHQLAITNVERTFTASPPFGSCGNCCCRHIIQ